MKIRQCGFTLVEIATILMIIGLVLGGILKSQELIAQARIKSLVNDFNYITLAVNLYQDRYHALPGDDANAATRWSMVAPGVVSGNGDGQFAGTYNNTLAAAPTSADETNTFWWHLRLAGFLAGSVVTGTVASQQPMNASNGIEGVQTGHGPATLGLTSSIVCATNLPDKTAIAIDTQLDDGICNAGRVRGILQADPSPALRAQAAADVYAENGTNQYTLCKNL